MQAILARPRSLAMALALATATAGAFGGGAGAATAEEPATCELRVSRQAGAVTLTALTQAERRVSGTYTLRVSGSGTNIRQGGPFQAAAGEAAKLGTVTLGSNGAGYEADLEILVGGDTVSCTKRIGGGI